VKRRTYARYVKRILDIIFAITGIVMSLPIMLLICPILYFANNGSLFFKQQRPGMNEIVFTIMKLKTMTDTKDIDGNLFPDRERLTRVGKIIRKFSLDEVPQLINVLKGEMSIVGPRPLLEKYLPLYSNYHSRRHDVRPGITGWAQINGRNESSWKKRLDNDIWYINEISFCLDMRIILKTILITFKRKGINSRDAATMKPFTGSKNYAK